VKIEGQASNSTLKAIFFDVKRLISMVEHLISEDCNTKSHIKILEQLDKKGSGQQVLNGSCAFFMLL
jgi:hypothetical protein